MSLFRFYLFVLVSIQASHSYLNLQEFKEMSKAYPLNVLISYSIKCAPHHKPNFTVELANELEHMDPPLGLLEIASNIPVSDHHCSGMIVFNWEGEKISFFIGKKDLTKIVDWVNKHTVSGDGHVVNVYDIDNPVIKKIGKVSVYATYDYRCKQRFIKGLNIFKEVAKQVRKQLPIILMFNYASQVLFKKNKIPICNGLPIYMYIGNKTLGREKFFEEKIEKTLLSWIKQKSSPYLRSIGYSKPFSIRTVAISSPYSMSDHGQIQQLDDDSFEKATTNTSADIVIAFLYDGCIRSTEFGRIYQNISKDIIRQNIPIKLAKVTAENNLVLLYKHAFGAFPILKFYRKGRAFSKLTGPTDKKKVITWIKEKLSSKSPDNRTNHLKSTVATSNGVLILEEKTHERALTENKLLVICYTPIFRFEHIIRWLRDIAEDYIAKNYSLKIATRTDHFINRIKNGSLYPLVVLYKDGEGIDHLQGKDNKMDIKDFLRESLEKHNLNATLNTMAGNLSVPQTTSDDVLILKNKKHFQMAQQDNDLILLASYPQFCCETFFLIFREISIEMKRMSKLSKIHLVELRDAFEKDRALIYPKIELTLFNKGKQIATFKIAEDSVDTTEKKRRIIKWVGDSLEKIPS